MNNLDVLRQVRFDNAACTNCPRHKQCKPEVSMGKVAANYVFVNDFPFSTINPLALNLFKKGLADAGLNPDNVFLTSLIRCGGSKIKKDELKICQDWLEAELSALERVDYVFPLGWFATKHVHKMYGRKVKTSETLKKLMGEPLSATDPIYHWSPCIIQPLPSPSSLANKVSGLKDVISILKGTNG